MKKKRHKWFGGFKGATAWEAWVGPFWVRWPFIYYMKLGIWPKFGYDREWNKRVD